MTQGMRGKLNIGSMKAADVIWAITGGTAVYLIVRGLMDTGRIHPDTPVSERFRVSDFLHSQVIPELKHYKVTPIQFENASRIARNILEPMWDAWGQIIITSGGRPVDVTDKYGRTFFELLLEEGYHPAKHSQHADFSAVDVQLLKRSYYMHAFQWLKNHPAIRQVILHINKNGLPNMLHIGVITPAWQAIEEKALLFTPEHKYVAATGKNIRERVKA